MSEKAVYDGGDRLKRWFYRQPTTYVARKVEAFAYQQGHVFSTDTFESALRGNKVFEGVVQVLKAFENDVEANLRQYYVPPGPPLSREEMVDWAKEDGMQLTWLWHTLRDKRFVGKEIAAKVPVFSTFSNFFQLYKSCSDETCTIIIEAIHAWHKDHVARFDRFEAADERQDARLREVAETCNRIRDSIATEVAAEWAAEGRSPRPVSVLEGTKTDFDAEVRHRVYEEALKILGTYDYLADARLPHEMDVT